MKRFLGFYALAVAVLLYGHGTEEHDKKKVEVKEKKEVKTTDSALLQKADSMEKVFEDINAEYAANIKPIFQKKCFDCHSDRTEYPWYYEVPMVKTLIDKDIKEAKSHIYMTKGFPFVSHETPLNDLKSIKQSILKGHMPPLRYLLTHWDATISEKERRAIMLWSKSGIEKIEKVSR